MDVIVVLLLGLALIVLLLAAALLIPATVSLTLVKEGPAADFRVAFGIMKGIISGIVHVTPEKRHVQLKVGRFTLLTRPLAQKEKPKRKRKKAKKHTEVKDLLVNADVLFVAGKDLVRALTRHIALTNLTGKVELGLADPAETGMLTGLLYAGSGIMQALLPQTQLAIAPSFDEERLDARLELQLRLQLGYLIRPLLRFLRQTRQLVNGT
jgi:hypothetical protein